jgi:subtilase family serine protease
MMVAACVAALLGATGTASAAAAPSGLSAVRTLGAVDAGALSGRRVAVTLVLAPRHPSGLRRAARTGGLTPRGFLARFAPSRASVRVVRRWARRAGLRVRSVSANRLLARVSGTPRAVGRAFGTSLRAFRAGSLRFFAPARPARLPRAVARRTTAVLGLSSLGRVGFGPRVRPAAHARAAQLPGISFPASYGPKDLWTLYDAPASATGAGQHVAVIAEGDVSQPQRDLVTFEQRFGLPQVPWHQVQVGAATSDKSGDDEWDLDTQYSTGLAANASQLDVYVASSLSNEDILATINRWVTDDASRQASFSAGECEVLAFATGFTAGLDTVLAQAAAQGQTLFVSSGDTGVFCTAIVGVNGVPAGLPSVEYPASSPFAIGVGGTTVLGPGPTEIAWYAGGGGSSFFEPTPAFQQAVGGSFAGVRRGVPDVALDADPLSGYSVIVNGSEETIGGTSASAPAWQGIWARAQSAKRGALGFAAPVIYRTEPGSAYHDIVLGGNPATATPGWDYVTGRGTPDITAFVNGA